VTGCLQAGARTATPRTVACRRGRRKAVSVTAPQPVDAQDDVIFNEPGRRAVRAALAFARAGETAGTRLPRVTRQRDTANGAALQITSLVRLPGSIRHDSPPAEPKFSFRGASRTGEHGVRPGASRLCAPVYADSSTIWRSVGVRAARPIGAQSKPARRLMAVVSAHCR